MQTYQIYPNVWLEPSTSSVLDLIRPGRAEQPQCVETVAILCFALPKFWRDDYNRVGFDENTTLGSNFST